MRRALVLLVALFGASLGFAQKDEGRAFVVGSKAFNESVILGEIIAQVGRGEGASVDHERQLGGSSVLFNALLRGEIDAYPEYTGTLRRELLAELGLSSDADLASALAARGVRMTWPLGFNNTYAIGMREERAEALGVGSISELREHPALSFGFTNEFMDRGDGWPALRAAYDLPQADVTGLQHELAYQGLRSGRLDAVDLYSTDAEIGLYDIRVLEDDRNFFTRYEAVVLYRAELERASPEWARRLQALAGRIDAGAMVEMNTRAKTEEVDEARIAADFLDSLGDFEARPRERAGLLGRVVETTREHLILVCIPMAAGVLVAVPLGVAAASSPRGGQIVLALVGIAQTIPSLALLALFVPALGIGEPPALVALFAYSLLPMVRSTQAGIRSIPAGLIESARAIGLGPLARLWIVELPLASRSILSGIKTSIVITIGFATLGAFIGAGGYGEPILTGIRRDDFGLILEGTLPAAGMAIAAQVLFEVLERVIVPRGLRVRAS